MLDNAVAFKQDSSGREMGAVRWTSGFKVELGLLNFNKNQLGSGVV